MSNKPEKVGEILGIAFVIFALMWIVTVIIWKTWEAMT